MKGLSMAIPLDATLKTLDLADEEVRTKVIEKFIDEYGQRLFNLIYWKTGNYEDAKDLTAEVIFKIYKALPKFRGDANLYTWAYRIAINHVNRFLLKRSLLKFVSFEDMKREPECLDARQDTDDSGLSEAVRQAVSKLPQKYRDVVVLFYFENCKYEEIAQILGISVGTVKSRLNRARSKLSKLLEGVIK